MQRPIRLALHDTPLAVHYAERMYIRFLSGNTCGKKWMSRNKKAAGRVFAAANLAAVNIYGVKYCPRADRL